MKHYRQYCTSLFLTTFILLNGIQSAQAATEPSTLTLSDSITLALENNPAMKIAQSNEQKAAWGVNEAKSHNGLSLGYNYSLGRTNQAPSWYNNTIAKYPSPLSPPPAWSDVSDGSTAYNSPSTPVAK